MGVDAMPSLKLISITTSPRYEDEERYEVLSITNHSCGSLSPWNVGYRPNLSAKTFPPADVTKKRATRSMTRNVNLNRPLS